MAREELDRFSYPIFFASEVYECLSSVPFNPAVGLRFIEYFNTTIQFQSTLAYLRDPPTGYQQPAIDVKVFDEAQADGGVEWHA